MQRINHFNMVTTYKILHIEEAGKASIVESALVAADVQFEVLTLQTKSAFIRSLAEFKPNLILCAHTHASLNAFEALRILNEQQLHIPLIVVAGTLSENISLSMFMKQGAADYILEGALKRLPAAVINAVEKYELENTSKIFISQEYRNHPPSTPALLPSAEKMLLATKVTGIGIWEYLVKEKRFIADDVLLSQYGLSLLEFEDSYDTWMTYVHPDDRESVDAEFQETLRSGTNFNTEFRVIWPDGTLHYIKAAGVIQKGVDGEPVVLIGTNQDITEARTAELNLRKSEARYKALFDQNLAGIYRASITGKILNCNDAFAKMMKFESAARLIETEVGAYYFHPTGLPQLLRDLTARKKLFNYSSTFKSTDGSKIQVLQNISLTKDEFTGEAVFDGIAIDITEMKQAEQEMSWLVNNTEESFILLDKNLDIVSFNKQFQIWYQRYLGKELERGKSILDYVVPDRKALVVAIYDRVLQGFEETSELVLRDTAAGSKIFDLKYKPATDQEGNTIGAFVTATDVTDKREAQRLLIHNEQRYRAMVENGTDGIIIITEAMQPVYISPSIEKLLGYSESEAASMNFFSLFHQEDLPGVAEVWQEVVAQPGVAISGYPIRLLHKTNGWRWFEATMTNMLHDPSIRGIVDNFRDVTERVMAQQEMEAQQKLLEEAETNYREIFDKASDAIFIHDMETGNIIDVNEKACELLGSHKKDIIANQALNMTFNLAGYTEELAREKLEKAATKGPQLFDWQCQRTDGSMFWVEVSLKKANIAGTEKILAFFRDISDRKTAEAQKEFDRRDKEALINATSDLMWSISSNFTLIAANQPFLDSLEKLSGLRMKPGEELLLGELYPAPVLTLWRNFYKRAFGGEAFSEEVHTVANGDTKENWSLNGFNPIYDGDQIIAVACSSRDITAEKEHENELISINKKLATAQQIAQLGYWELDMNYQTLFWSHEVYKIWGLPSTAVISFDVFANTIHPDDREKFDAANKRAFSGDGKMDIEHRIILPGDVIKHVHEKGELVYDDAGIAIHFEGTVQDITARKLVEDAFITTLTDKNIILESIADAFFAVDKNFVVTYWNQHATKLLNKSPEEMMGSHLWDVFPDSVGSMSYDMYQQAFELNEVVHFEDYYETDDRWFEISAYPSGRGLSVYFKDVSERKISDMKLNKLNADLSEKARELASTNAELEQFAFVASHDLQEPLRMVTSFLTLLEKKYAHELGDTGRKYIGYAVDGAKRMRQVILDLLEFSRVGVAVEKLETVDLNLLLQEVLSMFNKEILEKNAYILVDKLPVINTNATPLLQVFQNLVGNALKYVRNGIRPEIHISAIAFDDHWQFRIQDNGIGIAEEYFDRIFIIFQRLHNKDTFSGTGIGLAITKKIVDSFGGKIWLTSKEGEGTCFYFTLLKQWP